MPAPSDAPLRRVHINLYEADCATYESRFGRGWTEYVRLLVRKECEEWRKVLWSDDEDVRFTERFQLTYCNACDKQTPLTVNATKSSAEIICGDCGFVIAALYERKGR